METLAQILNFVLSLALITVLFAMIFKFLPDAKVAWHDVWIGAFITAMLFIVGKFALGLYLGKSAVGSSYGAAGSLIVLLLWVYYSSQILFFGAGVHPGLCESIWVARDFCRQCGCCPEACIGMRLCALSAYVRRHLLPRVAAPSALAGELEACVEGLANNHRSQPGKRLQQGKRRISAHCGKGLSELGREIWSPSRSSGVPKTLQN
jgi:hypothetical protein